MNIVHIGLILLVALPLYSANAQEKVPPSPWRTCTLDTDCISVHTNTCTKITLHKDSLNTFYLNRALQEKSASEGIDPAGFHCINTFKDNDETHCLDGVCIFKGSSSEGSPQNRIRVNDNYEIKILKPWKIMVESTAARLLLPRTD